jgi:ATP-binding protein involved in chromosome partitioning
MSSENPQPTTDDVEAALRAVRDPEMDVDVFEAGLVENVRVSGGDVTVEADLSEFRPSESESVSAAIVRAASSVEGVERAHVEHAAPDPAGREAGLSGVDSVVAVASAKGGVGKSTVAVNLACALAADEEVGVFDADLHGPNVPELLELSGPVHSDDDGHPLPVGKRGLEVMSVGLMESGAPLAWRGAMAHDALTELFEDTAWEDRDRLVVDLPPGTGDVALTTLQEVPVDGVVFVTTPFHAAVSDTHRSLQLFRENDVPVLGVVVNMDGFTCEECGHEHETFPGEDVARGLDAPVLRELPFDPDLQGTPTPGAPDEPFAAIADRVRERYDEIWNPAIPDDAVDLRGVPPEERHDRVAEAFAGRDADEEFVLVSDRDPSPVRGYLADVAGVAPDSIEPFRIRQPNPDTWLLHTVRP